MSLSNDLISQFVKATTNTKKVKTESVVYGTAKQHGDLMYVMLDGSDQLTPVSTTVAVKDGERVTIRIKDHSAVVTGNLTYPAAKNETVETLGKKVSYFDEISAYKITTDELDAIYAVIETLKSKTANIEELTAVTAEIETLIAKFAELDKVTIEDAEILKGKITDLEAEVAKIEDLSAEDFEAINADIGSLKSYVGNFTYLHADVLTAMKGEITELDTKKLSAESADLKYVNIDFANIDEAWFKKFYAESGIIRDVYADDATVTGYLVGVTIKGDLIEANTLKADKLVILGEDGIYYKLNFEAGTFKEGEAVPTDSLHGSIITAKSVTAEKVSVSDLVAFDATIAGFNITRDEDDGLGKIYSGVKESVDNTTRGIYLDNSGQVAFGDSSNYLKYFKDADGKWKLAISANAIVMSASGTSVDEAINEAKEELDNLQIGARNLIRNSKNLVFEDYEFEEAILDVTYDDEGNTYVDSNAVSAQADDGDAGVASPLFTPSDDSDGNVLLASPLDVEGNSDTVEMKTLTIGGITFEVVDSKARIDFSTMIGVLEDLLTEDKTDLVSAINEVYKRGGSGSGTGGGGGSISYTVTLTNLLDSRILTVPDGEAVVLRLNYSSVDSDGMDDGPGIGTLLVGGIVRQTFSAKQGEFELDITKYLASGTNNISVRVTNSENVSKTMTYTVTLVTVSLTSSFDASVPYTGAISFPYIPTGLATKTVHFELDGAEIGMATVTTSGRQVSYTIPAQSHGAHVLRVWFTCEVSGTVISSNMLYYSIICTVEGDTTPIIALTSPPVSGVEQFSNIVKKYRVYSPLSLASAITLEVNGKVVSSLTVDRTEQTWTYQPIEVGELVQTIRCGNAYVSWTQTVTESSIDVEAETEALALHLSSYGRSNNEANPGVWENNGISAIFSNFNFVSDGWVLDDENITVLRVTGDARLEIPYKIFAYDFRTTGKTLEFELATREVLNYDAEVLTCYSGNRGFIITAQQLSMASEQSSLGTRYKEDEHIRVSIVAEKRSENRLLLCYINGIMSGAVQYPDDDDFSQAAPVGITIGSNDCTVDLYNIRAYDNSLTRYQILDNWIADTQNSVERIDRYNRNEVYDVYGQIVISQLPSDLPYMVLQASVLPQFKGDKKTLNGYYTDPLHPERSFSIVDAQIDVQGTSSQYYYVKNYKIKYKNGFVLFDGSTAETYQMNSNAVPTDTFTMKADVASSEGAFNVVLSMLYNELCPFKTPAQEEDAKVRQCIEGFPIVMFWNNGTDTKFIGKYNFNNDKGTAEVFGFKPGDESWETLQNGTDRVGWHSADFSGDAWKTDFEARYPEDNVDTTRLQALAEWLVSTDTGQATGNAITAVTYNGVEYTTDSVEYRLAKFSAELSNHFVEEAIIFYYLFTEIFLSIDQREKNAFPTYLSDLGKWIVLFYDADSSCGTDNKGNLAFDYYLEDIDYTEGGEPIYNGQNSVLWKNLRATRYNEIMTMYQDMRVNNLISYDITIGKFNAHQSKWPEAIFNEDMYRKCLEPLIVSGDGEYLPMLQGKKEMWMKWWLYNRFRYLDSKYTTGTSKTNYIKIRARSKANVSLTAYTNMYGHVLYNAEMVEHRMTRGQEYEFVWAASGAEDAVIGIYDGDMITSLGDLAPLIAEEVNVSVATHLTSLKIGDASEDYRNYSLNSVTLGNNTLLRVLDVRNCPNLTAGPDVSGCTNIEEIYFDGTSITGLKLPNGGVLKILHLPGTMANLTIRNQTKLTEFVMPSYENVTTLWLENNNELIDPLTILRGMPENARVRIIGFDAEMTVDELYDFIAFLDTMRGLDENGNTIQGENGNNRGCAQISCTIHLDTITPYDQMMITNAQSYYPSLAVAATLVPYTVRFYNYDGTLLQTVYVDTYGGVAIYTGETPVRPNASVMEDWEFVGWGPESVNITGDTDCYAQYKNNASYARVILQDTISGNYENSRVKTIGPYAFYDCDNLMSVSFPAATYIGNNAFGSCASLNSVNFPAVQNVGAQLFRPNEALTKVEFPALTAISSGMFYDCTGLQIADFAVAVSMDASAFYYATRLSAVILRNTDAVCSLANVNAFGGTPVESGTGYIYVPSMFVDEYKSATNWSAYAAQIRAIEDYPDICGGK